MARFQMPQKPAQPSNPDPDKIEQKPKYYGGKPEGRDSRGTSVQNESQREEALQNKMRQSNTGENRSPTFPRRNLRVVKLPQ